MSKAGQRRMQKKARDFRELAASRPEKFRRVWQHLLVCWAEEIQIYGRNIRLSKLNIHSLETVFNVQEKAWRLLALSGGKAERLVGDSTRALLADESNRALAFLLPPQLEHICLTSLRELPTTRPEKFKDIWKKQLLGGWAEEIQKRGKNLRFKEHDIRSHKAVFSIQEHALLLLSLCGDDAVRMVGTITREFLTDECARAVALAVSPQMHHLCLNWDKFYKPRRKQADSTSEEINMQD